MDLQKLNLVELDLEEATLIDGGKGIGWAWLAEQIVENWNEIKQGVSDGWNGNYNG